jgi:hypothetical protein
LFRFLSQVLCSAGEGYLPVKSSGRFGFLLRMVDKKSDSFVLTGGSAGRGELLLNSNPIERFHVGDLILSSNLVMSGILHEKRNSKSETKKKKKKKKNQLERNGEGIFFHFLQSKGSLWQFEFNFAQSLSSKKKEKKTKGSILLKCTSRRKLVSPLFVFFFSFRFDFAPWLVVSKRILRLKKRENKKL